MNAKILKRDLISEIEVLPLDELKTVAEFVEFIRDKQLEDDIFKSARFLKEIKKARKDWLSKKKDQFINWEDLKRKHSS